MLHRSIQDTGLKCVEACDSGGYRDCLVLPNLFVKTGDGPWQSEMTSHSGDSKPCRFCNVGGSVQERSSDEGFLDLMKVCDLKISRMIFI